MDLEKVQQRYLRLKHKVEAQLWELQQQRLEQLTPSRLTLPAPWQPIVYEQPTVMFKVVAAQAGQFTSVFDSSVVYQLSDWTHARAGCSGAHSWPPLWSCLYAYSSPEEARHTVFPRSSQQQKGARVLCEVSVLGKGYSHPDGRVAVSSARLDTVLEYLPKGPAEQVVAVDYGHSHTHYGLRSSRSSRRTRNTQRAAALTLAPELQQAVWAVSDEGA